MRLEEQFYFSSRDLESLSASVMYSFDPSRPFRPDMMSISRAPPISIAGFSPRTDFLEDYKKEQDELAETMKRLRREEEKRKREEEKEMEERLRKFNSLHTDFVGNSWSKSWGVSTDYIKEIPQGSLHIHAPSGVITGAKLVGKDYEERISNYDAAMLDLQDGEVFKDNEKW